MIKLNMKMPKNCNECPFHGLFYCTLYKAIKGELLDVSYELKEEIRSHKCLLINDHQEHCNMCEYATSGGCQYDDIAEVIPTEGKPCDDVVSREVFEQVVRERNIAIEQLNELGYEFGEKIEQQPCDDMSEV